MATKLNLFPLGVATGTAHCNRKAERQQLKEHILGLTHTWIWARRRMGKTSLIEQVLQDLITEKHQVVAMIVDLLLVHDVDAVERRIRGGVERLGAQLLPKGQKTSSKLVKAFSGFNPQLSVAAKAADFKLARPDNLVQGIAELLLGLDRAAGLYKRPVVVVLDEFQQLTHLKDGRINGALERAIRHAVERAKHVSYVFAGSQKHLLASMFEDEDRPLHHLCRKITLEPIEAAAYGPFLVAAGKARWRRTLPDPIIEQILTTTHRHPYYVNALCARLWSAQRPPTPKSIAAQWNALVAEGRSVVATKVLRLSATQRAMLQAIAQATSGAIQPTSREFLETIRLPSSTGNKAKEVLEQEDLIEQDELGGWRLVDPAMAAYLRRH